MLQKLTWRSFILSFCLVLLPCFVVGFLWGEIAWSLCFGLMILLGWNYYQQLKLSYWLWQDKSMTPPTAKGHWEVIFYGLLQLQKRNKKRRSELSRLIKRFRRGAESLPDALVMTTEEGTIFWCNRLAEQLLGFKWPSDNGQNILNLLRFPELANYLQNKKFDDPLTLTLFNQRDIEFRVMPYIEDAWIIMARDVTQLRQVEVARRQFFNNASHELGTPLTVLKGYLDLIDEDALKECLPENALKTMRAQTHRMESLVSQLLELSRLEYHMPLKLTQKVDLSALLETILLSVQPLDQQKHPFVLTIEDDMNVRGSEEELRSAMSNLIENAIKHTPENSLIEISLTRTLDSKALFKVVDKGQGIAQEHLPRITERFYRIDDSRHRQSGGSGIGLAIVKHVLVRHSSTLIIESELGKGSTFSFELSLI